MSEENVLEANLARLKTGEFREAIRKAVRDRFLYFDADTRTFHVTDRGDALLLAIDPDASRLTPREKLEEITFRAIELVILSKKRVIRRGIIRSVTAPAPSSSGKPSRKRGRGA